MTTIFITLYMQTPKMSESFCLSTSLHNVLRTLHFKDANPFKSAALLQIRILANTTCNLFKIMDNTLILTIILNVTKLPVKSLIMFRLISRKTFIN